MKSLKDVFVFVGSSSEGLDVARAVKRQFRDITKTDLWNEGVFLLNKSNLDSLLKAANLYDFAILCLTPDDLLRSRGKKHSAPRDNILFELGLFMGRMGIYRTFVICEERAKLPSDFAGISVSTFSAPQDGNLLSAVSNACSEIREAMQETLKKSMISYYPSTALAYGYFENFIQKVRPALLEKKEITINKEKVDYKTFSLNIMIPASIADVDRERNLFKNVNVDEYKKISLETPARDFPFYLDAKFESGSSNILQLYDFPTTLVASAKVIKLISGKDYIQDDPESTMLELREIGNFADALDVLCKDLDDVVINRPGQRSNQ
jgi:hypothetical protein